ncbi:MAG: hypothetical protein U1F55_02555, partial [Chitinivorax sp.]
KNFSKQRRVFEPGVSIVVRTGYRLTIVRDWTSNNHLHDLQIEAGVDCSAFPGHFSFPQSVDFPPIGGVRGN